MSNTEFKIERYSDAYRHQMLLVWEKSVLATHSFLKPSDFEAIKSLVQNIDFNDFDVFCAKQDTKIAGFIGVAEQKIEMLFLSPEHIGKGLGMLLTEVAISTLKADKVDVNEQNTNAVKFYGKLGFVPYERTEMDDQGKGYPLLRMRLQLNES